MIEYLLDKDIVHNEKVLTARYSNSSGAWRRDGARSLVAGRKLQSCVHVIPVVNFRFVLVYVSPNVGFLSLSPLRRFCVF